LQLKFPVEIYFSRVIASLSNTAAYCKLEAIQQLNSQAAFSNILQTEYSLVSLFPVHNILKQYTYLTRILISNYYKWQEIPVYEKLAFYFIKLELWLTSANRSDKCMCRDSISNSWI